MKTRSEKYKLIIVLSVLSWAWSSVSGYQAHDTVSSRQADQWRYIEHKLYIEPQKKARSYFERYITGCFTIGCWCVTTFFNIVFLLSLIAPVEQQDDDPAFNEQAGPNPLITFRVITGICASASLFFTLATTSLIQLRNNYFLVRAAEKEVLTDLCKNLIMMRSALPKELLPKIEHAARLYACQPEEFNRRAAQFIHELKQAKRAAYARDAFFEKYTQQLPT